MPPAFTNRQRQPIQAVATFYGVNFAKDAHHFYQQESHKIKLIQTKYWQKLPDSLLTTIKIIG